MLFEQHLSGSIRKTLEDKTQTRFYDRLQYLKEEIEQPKKPKFDLEERELLIGIYKSHPPLWNQMQLNIVIEICVTLIEKLVDQFENKFKKQEIKQEWHSFQTSYKSEKSKEEVSKASRAGCPDVYYSTWKYYNQMDFLDVTTSVDDSHTSLDTEPYILPKRKKQEKKKKKCKIRGMEVFS